MTAKLAEILAEEWKAEECRPAWDEVYGPVVHLDDDLHIVGNRYVPEESEAESSAYTLRQARVVVLGKDALAYLVKNEFGSGENASVLPCRECGHYADGLGPAPEYGHAPDCEWGRIVAAAKEIG